MNLSLFVRRPRSRSEAPLADEVAVRTGYAGLLRRLLALADLLAAIVSVLAFESVWGGRFDQALWAVLVLPATIVIAKLNGLYDRDQRVLRHLTVDELPAVSLWAAETVALLAGFLRLSPAGSIGPGTAIRIWLVLSGGAFVLRGAARWIWRQATPPERVLVAGPPELAVNVRRKLELFPDIHARVTAEVETIRAGMLNGAPRWLAEVDRILLASSAIDGELIPRLVSFCRRDQVKLSIVPPVPGLFGTAVQLNRVADLPLLEYNTWHTARSTLFLKRLIDVAVAAVALVLALPLLLLAAVAVRLDSPGPALFRQRRATTGGRPFTMLKFRTMVQDAEELLSDLVSFDDLDEPMFKLRDDPRVTRVGRVLRRTSLDELPQLLNVLRGDMSLVGPRPEQVEVVALYAPEHRFRLSVKPGLTGPMQVYGRGALSFEERLSLEREYVENISLRRDLQILALTLSAIVGGRGAY